MHACALLQAMCCDRMIPHKQDTAGQRQQSLPVSTLVFDSSDDSAFDFDALSFIDFRKPPVYNPGETPFFICPIIKAFLIFMTRSTVSSQSAQVVRLGFLSHPARRLTHPCAFLTLQIPSGRWWPASWSSLCKWWSSWSWPWPCRTQSMCVYMSSSLTITCPWRFLPLFSIFFLLILLFLFARVQAQVQHKHGNPPHAVTTAFCHHLCGYPVQASSRSLLHVHRCSLLCAHRSRLPDARHCSWA